MRTSRLDEGQKDGNIMAAKPDIDGKMYGRSSRRRVGVAIVASLALLLAACGGDTGGSSTPAIDLTQESTIEGAGADSTGSADGAEPAESGGTDTSDSDDSGGATVGGPEPAEPTATPEPVVEERSIEDVAVSTVKIEAEGSYVPVGVISALSGQWNGTGFIINDEGYVVTNNHVVAGAALLRVSGPGIDGTVNARVLGVSECSDLAVIDLEGAGYTGLEFRTDPVNPGLAIFAAGYPGGGGGIDDTTASRDYTVTGGIVSNTTTDGRTAWASVDTVIEHDARIRGGNSGGPLVDEQARVVGINYAGADEDFNFAIAAQQARPLIDRLQDGDVESLGINGEAYVDPEISGVWVQAVDPGSPADVAGLEAGDFILSMNELAVGQNGTLASYCDVIRSNGPNDVIDIEVLRLGTDELLTGQINGEPLATTFSFANELADDVGDGAPAGAGGEYGDYEFVTDDTGSVGVDVPVQWTDRNGEANEEFGPSIYAAPDLSGFLDTWNVPGIVVEVSYDLGPANHDDVLGLITPDCVDNGAEDFETGDGAFAGRWQFFTECGGTETALVSVAASPPDGGMVVRMVVQVVAEADIAALDRAIDSFDASTG